MAFSKKKQFRKLKEQAIVAKRAKKYHSSSSEESENEEETQVVPLIENTKVEEKGEEEHDSLEESNEEESENEEGDDVDGESENTEGEEEQSESSENDSAADENDEIEDEDSEFDKETDEENGSSTDEPKPRTQFKDLGNAGWADAISKVLASSKPKTKKSVILSRAKRDIDIMRTRKEKEGEAGFEVEGDEKQPAQKKKKVETDKATDLEKKQQRKEWDLIGRVKPNVLTGGKERQLSRIATKGVVQLFNAVRVQQKTLSAELRDAGPLERKREQVLKSLSRDKFMNILNKTASKDEAKELKKEVKEEPLWGVLRDDFMEGGKNMKDWDKLDSEDEPS